jgi:NAD(P)-dependent dehydrogenase (short-subunit alcohol dehydrogenase family)
VVKLAGRVAIVTGGARNIGQRYALALARAGASVVASDLRDASETVELIESESGKALAVSVDVSDPASVAEMVKKAVERFGRVDVLVNNAALYGDLEPGPIEALTPEIWDRTMAVNVKGVFLCTRAVLPIMRQQKSGSIINISSGTFWVGSPGAAHYVASKGAVIGFTRSAAREAGSSNIRVNAVTPGFTMSQASIDGIAGHQEIADQVVSLTALGRSEQPDDLVGTIVFLASDDSAFITGQTINVDGGFSMH